MFFRRSANALLPTLYCGFLGLLAALACLPAHADGYWLLHVSVVGTPTTTGTNSLGGNVPSMTWTAPPDAPNTITLPSYTSIKIGVSCSPGQTQSCTAGMSLSVKITGTWKGSDPAPANVKIIESGQATASGEDSSGYSTPTLSAYDGLESSPAGSGVAVTPTTDASGHPLVPPAHLSTQSGGSWTVTKTFSASAKEVITVPSSATGGPYSCFCTARLDKYTLAVHA